MEGELLGVSATDALELGIDIGELDCAISVGFPGTVASLRQQWGRAGRRGHGLAVLVASEDALDQFFMREPEALLERRVEATRLDHANPRILDPHVYAAAYEGPLAEPRRGDARARGARARGGAAGARADAGRVRLEGARHAGRAVLAPLGRPGLVHDRRRDDRLRPRPRRARARVLGRPRGRRLPPPRRAVPRARARRRRAHGGRRAGPGGLVHAGQEGHADRDRGDAPRPPRRRRRAPVRPRLGDRAGDRLPAEGDLATARRSTSCR